MEAVGLALGTAQTLFTALQTKEVRDMCSMFRCESQLGDLKDTVETVKAVLLDIDSKSQGLTHEGQLWVEKLKDAVYDVDDLLDEFTTISQQRKHMRHDKFSKKIGQFFSRNNRYFVAFNVSREIKMLREKLDGIAKNHADFGFRVVTEPVKRREETCSTISDLEVIGREMEKEDIVGMLLSEGHSSDRNVSFVNIVGMGGLGKTTLAQLVYNDERVKGAFSNRMWVCVSEEFVIREILGKMLQKKDSTSTLEEMQREVRTLLGCKRYLLVLDDVWNESKEEWRKLKPFLVSDVSGSKIIVTSRSKKVGTSIGHDSTMYELKGLSEENSWRLFKSIAFEGREDQLADSGLVDVGKGIVKKCANVPLSIKVIASLLYDQDKSQWQMFASSNDLANMSHDGRLQNSIMATLKFSYYQLTSELKSCFSFCSLFPKDQFIEKELLIELWLAQGFLTTTHDAQSMEGVGERYITILLNRCFFQDARKDREGEVYQFKMHDLMHDLALDVAGKESLHVTPVTEKNLLGKKIRHLSTCEAISNSNMCLSDNLRTCICSTFYTSADVTAVMSKCRRLRALSLRDADVAGTTLSDHLGKLLHLRYLDLSWHHTLEMLPKSITKLHNLQILKLSECLDLKVLPEDMSKLVNLRTLDLSDCVNLEGLPEDMSKLVNLKTLDISDCDKLTYMPRGMSNLTNLHTLTEFVVGGVNSKQTQGSKLVDLQDLRSLKGHLCIKIRNFCSQNMPHSIERAFILKDAHLKKLDIRCGELYCVGRRAHEYKFDQSEVHEKLVEDLCPNDDIRSIEIQGYEGTKLPSWASRMESDMNGVQQVTSLSRFRHLKVLTLKGLRNVEYIESDTNELRTFFPVLEELMLLHMPKLKGWWREARWMEMEGGGGCWVDANDLSCQIMSYFPRLQELSIEACESMTYFPPCPNVKRLTLKGVNEALRLFRMGGVIASASSSSSSSFSSSSMPGSMLCLDKLVIDKARVMNSILRDDFVRRVVHIELKGLKSMGTGWEGLERVCWALRSLTFSSCYELDVDDEEEEISTIPLLLGVIQYSKDGKSAKGAPVLDLPPILIHC